jgi:hypothetical protein
MVLLLSNIRFNNSFSNAVEPANEFVLINTIGDGIFIQSEDIIFINDLGLLVSDFTILNFIENSIYDTLLSRKIVYGEVNEVIKNIDLVNDLTYPNLVSFDFTNDLTALKLRNVFTFSNVGLNTLIFNDSDLTNDLIITYTVNDTKLINSFTSPFYAETKLITLFNSTIFSETELVNSVNSETYFDITLNNYFTEDIVSLIQFNNVIEEYISSETYFNNNVDINIDNILTVIYE